jgi:hypothetical protein
MKNPTSEVLALIQAYRKLHTECLRLVVASSDHDTNGRLSAPFAAWKAMGDAMDALPDNEKLLVVMNMPAAEIAGMQATADKLALILAGGRLS